MLTHTDTDTYTTIEVCQSKKMYNEEKTGKHRAKREKNSGTGKALLIQRPYNFNMDGFSVENEINFLWESTISFIGCCCESIAA